MASNCYSILELTLIGLCIVCHNIINAHVLVYRRATNQLIEEYNDLPAQFGPSLPVNGLKVFVVPAEPSEYGCVGLLRPPRAGYPVSAKFVALISRGGDCTFEHKVRVAQNATYFAVIVYNNEGDDLEQMSAENSTGIFISSVFVGHTTGKTLKSFFTPEVVLIINDELPFNINTQLILPFSILIGLCFLIMVIYMVYKCIRERRRLRRNRLPKNMLKKIPILRYTKNNQFIKYDTCIICLEEFVEDDRLRVLPCSHPYHSHCIDPWLTQNRRVCPICKRKVFTKGEARANRNRQPSLDNITDTDDDTTPLLQQQQSDANTSAESSNSVPGNNTAATRHGTFRRDDTVSQQQDNQSSDEENALLDRQSATRHRINPFDRSPNLPAHLAEQLSGPQLSFWSRLNTWFVIRRQPANISVAAPAYIEHVEAGTSAHSLAGGTTRTTAVTPSVATPTPTSNNILNPNLSGSFKDDDESPPHRSIYEPIAAAAAATPSSNITANAMANNDSAFIQTPTQGGIGVAALPHIDE